MIGKFNSKKILLMGDVAYINMFFDSENAEQFAWNFAKRTLSPWTDMLWYFFFLLRGLSISWEDAQIKVQWYKDQKYSSAETVLNINCSRAFRTSDWMKNSVWAWKTTKSTEADYHLIISSCGLFHYMYFYKLFSWSQLITVFASANIDSLWI